jgi:hypothetical protein
MVRMAFGVWRLRRHPAQNIGEVWHPFVSTTQQRAIRYFAREIKRPGTAAVGPQQGRLSGPFPRGLGRADRRLQGFARWPHEGDCPKWFWGRTAGNLCPQNICL